MRKLKAILIIPILLLACQKVPTFPSGDNPDNQYNAEKTTDDLRIELNFKSKEITEWEDIEAEFILTNISDETLIYNFSSGCQYGYTIENPENKILDSRHKLACTANLTKLELKPDATKTYSISLKRIKHKEKLENGIYKFSTFLLDSHGANISTFFEVK